MGLVAEEIFALSERDVWLGGVGFRLKPFFSQMIRMSFVLQLARQVPLWTLLGTEFLLHSGLLERRRGESACTPIAEEVVSLRNRVRQVEEESSAIDHCPVPESCPSREWEAEAFQRTALCTTVGNLLGGLTWYLLRKALGCCVRRRDAEGREAQERQVSRRRGGGILR